MLLSAAVCQNLGPRQTRKRRLLGLLSFQIAVILSVIFIWLNVSDLVRATVFIPYFVAYLGVLQSLQKTCVILAFQGKQNLDTNEEIVTEELLRRKLKSKSIGILVLAMLLALLCTYLTLAIHLEFMAWPQQVAV